MINAASDKIAKNIPAIVPDELFSVSDEPTIRSFVGSSQLSPTKKKNIKNITFALLVGYIIFNRFFTQFSELKIKCQGTKSNIY